MKIRIFNEDELRSPSRQLGDDLSILAEGLRTGFFVNSPLSEIIRSIRDLALFAAQLAEQGFEWKRQRPMGKQLKPTGNKFEYRAILSNTMIPYIPSKLELEQVNSPDPLIYETDKDGLFPAKSVSWIEKDEVRVSASLAEALDLITDITSVALRDSDLRWSDIDRLTERRKVAKIPRKLSREQYYYYSRKRAPHKRTNK